MHNVAAFQNDRTRSAALAAFLHSHMGSLAKMWVLGMGALSAIKLCFPAAPFHSPMDALPIALVYAAIIAAPIAGFMITRAAFSGPVACSQPSLRLAVYGRWKKLSARDARGHPDFGPVGFVALLMLGLLLNVVFRAGEFLLAVPAMGSGPPEWASALFILMAFDLSVTGFFYMAAFVMALRTIPLFPRMLLFAWVMDVALQLTIASKLASLGTLPAEVAAPLLTLLEGNLTKVFISAALWLPYLILSDRVNITYRHRRSG